MTQVAVNYAFDITDRALTLGDGVFDTCLMHNGRIIDGVAHLERLLKSCHVMGYGNLRAILAVHYDAVPSTTGYVARRITVTGGAGTRGLAAPTTRKVNVIVQDTVWSAEAMFPPLTAIFSTIRRNETSPSSRHKTVCYLDNVFAKIEAEGRGVDDGLFLNSRGHLACATAGNVFVLSEQGTLMTTYLEDGALDGITRQKIIKIAQENGVPFCQAHISRDEMLGAKGIFVTNSLRQVCPVVLLENQKLRSAEQPIFDLMAKQIQHSFLMQQYAKLHA